MIDFINIVGTIITITAIILFPVFMVKMYRSIRSYKPPCRICGGNGFIVKGKFYAVNCSCSNKPVPRKDGIPGMFVTVLSDKEAERRAQKDFLMSQLKAPIEFEKEQQKDEIAEDLLKDIDPTLTDNDLVESMITNDGRTAELQKKVDQYNAEEMAKLDDPNWKGPIGFADIIGPGGTDFPPQGVTADSMPLTSVGQVSEGLSSSSVAAVPVQAFSPLTQEDQFFKADGSSNSSVVVGTGPGKITGDKITLSIIDETSEIPVGIVESKKGPSPPPKDLEPALGKRKLDI